MKFEVNNGQVSDMNSLVRKDLRHDVDICLNGLNKSGHSS